MKKDYLMLAAAMLGAGLAGLATTPAIEPTPIEVVQVYKRKERRNRALPDVREVSKEKSASLQKMLARKGRA